MVKGKMAGAYLRLATSEGATVSESLASKRFPRAPRCRRVQSEKVLGGKLLAFRASGSDHGRPRALGDTLTLPPLGDRPVTLPDGVRQLRDGPEALEQLGDRFRLLGGFHPHDIAGDELSRQVPSIIPVTREPPGRTIRPMGRGVTPVRYRAEIAERLRSARIMAGYSTQAEFAKALGIELERYKKWESGRTPIPYQYVPIACALLSIDANYLFLPALARAQKVATA